MKDIINVSGLFVVLFFCPVVSADKRPELAVYSSGIGEIGVYSHAEKQDVFAVTGGQPNGGATGADCAIRAEIAGDGIRLVGKLLPIKTALSRFDEKDIKGKSLIMERISDSYIISEIDDVDLCGWGVTFVNAYQRVERYDPGYREAYFKLAELAHENALNMYKAGELVGAINSLSAYINSDSISFLNDKKASEWYVVFANDYAYFLEQSGQLEEAISLLEKIVVAVPERKSAWLNLGDAYWGMGQPSKAKTTYEQYIKLIKYGGEMSLVPVRVSTRLGS